MTIIITAEIDLGYNKYVKEFKVINHLIEGGLKVINFDDFLNLIGTKIVNPTNNIVFYNQLASTGEDTGGFDIFEYQQRAVMLKPGPITVADVLSQASISRNFYEPIGNLIQQAAVNFMMNFGDSEYLLKLAPRTYAFVQLDDFVIFRKPDENGDLVALALYNSLRFNAVSVLKETLKDAEDTLKTMGLDPKKLKGLNE